MTGKQRPENREERFAWNKITQRRRKVLPKSQKCNAVGKNCELATEKQSRKTTLTSIKRKVRDHEFQKVFLTA
jgi:hypothetical protein